MAKNDAIAPLWLIACAMTIVLFFGALLLPAANERAIDYALVVSRLVAYPPDSVMIQPIYGSWTLLNQLGALFLLAGLSQTALDSIINIFPLALLAGASAMVVFGFSQRPVFALAAAMVCVLSNPLSRFFESPDYPLLSSTFGVTEDTWGAWGGVGAAWVLAALAGGRNLLAGLSGMVLVAIHPVLGFYMVGLLLIVLALGLVRHQLPIDGLRRGLVLGAVVTVASLIVYLLTRPHFSSEIDPIAYRAFMRFWDYHRNQVMTNFIAVKVGAASLLAIIVLSAFLYLSRLRQGPAIIAATAMLVAVIVSTLSYYAGHLISDFLPDLFTRVIPGRFLNVQAYLASAIALGLAAYAVDRGLFRFSLSLFPRIETLVEALETKLTRRPNRADRSLSNNNDMPMLRTLFIFALMISVASINFPARQIINSVGRKLNIESYSSGHDSQSQVKSDAFWEQVRQSDVKGLVLTSYEATRPALFYGHLAVALDVTAIDFVPYFPYTAKTVGHIVEKAYGIAFYNPPREYWFGGTLLPDSGRDYWAGFTLQDWQRLSREFGIEALVAPNNWTIGLPILVTGSQFTLYKIVGSTTEPRR